jgi:hypothetical protein
MNELRSRTNADLLQVATSKDYGKATRKAARDILAERGVTVDDATFANPSAGNVPPSPEGVSGFARALPRIIFVVLIGVAIGLVKFAIRN